MEGKTTAEYTFKRRSQAITLDTKSTENLEDVFKYELCSFPPAHFNSSLLLREPQKPQLADAIWTLLTPDVPGITGEVQYVIDGGALVEQSHGQEGPRTKTYAWYIQSM